jgi:hypothetical protein
VLLGVRLARVKHTYETVRFRIIMKTTVTDGKKHVDRNVIKRRLSPQSTSKIGCTIMQQCRGQPGMSSNSSALRARAVIQATDTAVFPMSWCGRSEATWSEELSSPNDNSESHRANLLAINI